MNQLTFIDKVQVLFKLLFSSPIIIGIFVFSLFLMILLFFYSKLNKKIIKYVFILIYVLLIGFAIFKYGSYFLTSIDSFLTLFMANIYFPTIPVYVTIMLISFIIMIITLSRRKGSKVVKIINTVFFTLIQMLFAIFIFVIEKNNIDVSANANLYSNEQTMTLLELGMGFFVVWMIILLVILYLKKADKIFKTKKVEEQEDFDEYINDYNEPEKSILPVIDNNISEIDFNNALANNSLFVDDNESKVVGLSNDTSNDSVSGLNPVFDNTNVEIVDKNISLDNSFNSSISDDVEVYDDNIDVNVPIDDSINYEIKDDIVVDDSINFNENFVSDDKVVNGTERHIPDNLSIFSSDDSLEINKDLISNDEIEVNEGIVSDNQSIVSDNDIVKKLVPEAASFVKEEEHISSQSSVSNNGLNNVSNNQNSASHVFDGFQFLDIPLKKVERKNDDVEVLDIF